MKEQTSFKTFFLNNQAVGTAECPQGDFEAKDGVIVGAAQCSYGAQNFTIYIRVSGDMVTTYTAQSAMTRGGLIPGGTSEIQTLIIGREVLGISAFT